MAGAEMESAEWEALVAEEADIVAWEDSRWWRKGVGGREKGN